NYKPVVARNQSNGYAGTKACDDADPPFSSSPKDSPDAGFKPSREEEKKDAEDPGNEGGNPCTEEPIINQEKDASVNNTNNINTNNPTVNAASIEDNVVDENIVYGCADDPYILDLEEISRFSDAKDDGAEADMTNLDTHIPVSPILTTRIHKDYPLNQVIGDLQSATQIRQMTKNLEEYGNQDSKNREPIRRIVPVEENTSNALVSQCDGFGYDWSDQAEEGPTNFALMAYSSTSSSSSTNFEVSNDSNCCSSCLECVKDLKEPNEQLVKDLRIARISVVSYKTGLESVEGRLLVFKKNESVYEEDIKLLKHEIYLRDLDITELKRKLELATKEKDAVQLIVQKFENSSKSLSKLLDSQIIDKCKTGLQYNAVLPPYTRNFMSPKPDLVYPSLDDFVEVNESVSEFIVRKPTVETNEPETARKENRALII
ncbi:hypothetical protein Tco_0696743, partial [Tanacetum coccineum]